MTQIHCLHYPRKPVMWAPSLCRVVLKSTSFRTCWCLSNSDCGLAGGIHSDPIDFALLSRLIHHVSHSSSATLVVFRLSVTIILIPIMRLFTLFLFATLCFSHFGQAHPLPKAGHHNGKAGHKCKSRQKQIILIELESSRSLTCFHDLHLQYKTLLRDGGTKPSLGSRTRRPSLLV